MTRTERFALIALWWEHDHPYLDIPALQREIRERAHS